MKLTFATIRNLVLAGLLVGLGGVAGYRVGNTGVLIGPPTKKGPESVKLVNFQTKNTQVSEADFAQFWEVWGLLQQEYIEPEKIVAEDMINGAIEGLASSLDDPYTAYLPPEENQRASEDLSGAFYGVGIQLGYIDDTLAVIAPLKGTPAESVGIEAGDLILRVRDDDKDLDQETTGWSLQEAVNNIRGKKGTTVALTLFRPEEGEFPEPFEVEVPRGEIVVPSVELVWEERAGVEIAHLQVSRFGDRTEEEWDQAVSQILAKKDAVGGIVLDMRNNPGGIFDQAVMMLSDFIDNGVLVTQSGRYSSRPFKSNGSGRLKDIPTVVLVNRGSASASEIVAGALRDRLDLPLVGTQTFGKGTVQDRQILSNKGAIHVTVAKWLLPSGEWLDHEGLPVSVEIKDDPETEEVDEALEVAIDQFAL